MILLGTFELLKGKCADLVDEGGGGFVDVGGGFTKDVPGITCIVAEWWMVCVIGVIVVDDEVGLGKLTDTWNE